jgi:hypothetical protein
MHDVLVLALTIFRQEPGRLRCRESEWRILLHGGRAANDPVLRLDPHRWHGGCSRPRAGAAATRYWRDGDGARKYPNLRLELLIILATVFFALGIIMPTIRFTTVYVWTTEHLILTIIYALFENDEIFLCAVVFAVSVFFPFLKLFYLLTLITSHDMPPDFRKKSIATMEWLGRYSMTDVMVLALMIFYVNSSGYTEARVLPGVYFFAPSALMTMLAYGWANASPPARRRSAKGGGPSFSIAARNKCGAA